MMKVVCLTSILALAGSSSAPGDANWLWQFTDDGEERASKRINRNLAIDEASKMDETIWRGVTEINQMIQGEGEGEAAGAYGEGEVNAPNEVRIYEALRTLNPDTLNVTIYWNCISVNYDYLVDFGAFQKNDENYQRCEAEGHYLFERSCLHIILVASNCFDGTWNCGSHWVNNVDQAVMSIDRASQNWPQCFTPHSTLESSTLTWDCEKRCDLPCTYPNKFCSTIERSYETSECKLDCPGGRLRRLSQGNVHDMTLTIGNVNSVPSMLPTPPPTAAPTTHRTPTPTSSPSTLEPASPTPHPTDALTQPTPETVPTLAPTSVAITSLKDNLLLTFSFAIHSLRSISTLQGDQHFIREMRRVGLKVLGLPDTEIGWITVALTQSTGRRLYLHPGRRLDTSLSVISVDYSAQIPQAAVGDVSIVSDPAVVEAEFDAAIQNAESASGISYGVTVDSASITALTNGLGSRWTAVVNSESGGNSTTTENQTMTTTSTTSEKKIQGFTSASARKSLATWSILIAQIAIGCFPRIVAYA